MPALLWVVHGPQACAKWPRARISAFAALWRSLAEDRAPLAANSMVLRGCSAPASRRDTGVQVVVQHRAAPAISRHSDRMRCSCMLCFVLPACSCTSGNC